MKGILFGLLSRQLESELEEVVLKEGPIVAIKRLCDVTGVGFPDAKLWVHTKLESLTKREKTTCRYCGKALPTAQARQCLKCGMDWHDLNNVVRRGNQQWNKASLLPQVTYVVELCQSPDGKRYSIFRPYPWGERDAECAIETAPATGRQILEWGLDDYADHLLLTNGEDFTFNASGDWLTRRELDFLVQNKFDKECLNQKGPPWVNGIPPLFGRPDIAT